MRVHRKKQMESGGMRNQLLQAFSCKGHKMAGRFFQSEVVEVA